MTEFVVVVFPDEKKAYEGVRALKELHEEGSLSVYSEQARKLTQEALRP